MPDYTITLTAEQDAALDVLIPRVNATLDKDAVLYTKASYLQERAAEVVDSYVAQLLSEDTQTIMDAYKAADATKRGTVRSVLV